MECNGIHHSRKIMSFFTLTMIMAKSKMLMIDNNLEFFSFLFFLCVGIPCSLDKSLVYFVLQHNGRI